MNDNLSFDNMVQNPNEYQPQYPSQNQAQYPGQNQYQNQAQYPGQNQYQYPGQNQSVSYQQYPTQNQYQQYPGQNQVQYPAQNMPQGSTKFCKHCGQRIAEQAVICPLCGCQVEQIGNTAANQPIIINNNNNTKTLDSGSQSNSSVVVKQKKLLSFKEFCDYVNADIRSEGNLDSKDLTALLYKNDFDYELYQKYQNSSIDVATLIKKFSDHLFRWVLVSWPRPVGNEKKIEELLLYSLTNKRFKGKEEKINSLSRAQISDLFFTVLELFDPEKPRYISKTKGAYMIGVIDNVLGQT